MHLTVENCWNGDHLSDNCVIQWMFRTRTIFYQYPDFDLPAYFGVACWNYVVAGIVMMVTAPPAWFVRLWPQPPERRARFAFPYYTFIVLLIFVQCKYFMICAFLSTQSDPFHSLGLCVFLLCMRHSVTAPLSFLADYIYMDQDSIFHVIDRMVAVPLMTLELWKVSCLWRWQAYVDITTSTSIATRTVPKSTSYYDDYHKITVVVLYSFGTIMAVGCFLLSQQSQSLRNINGFILWHNRWHL